MPIIAPATLPTDRPIYRESAPQMRERLRIMFLAYMANQPAFAGLNPFFAGADFADGWKLAAAAATNVKDHDTREAARMDTGLTEQEALAACRPRCQSLFYAVRQAWPLTDPNGKATQAAKLKEFGQDKYEVARDDPARMVALIEQAAIAYATPGYAALLAPKGWLADPQQKALTDAAKALAAAGATHGHQSGVNAGDAGAYYLAQNQVSVIPATGTGTDRFEQTLVDAELLSTTSTYFDLAADGTATPAGDPCP